VRAAALVTALAVLFTVPSRWCRRPAAALYRGDLPEVLALARGATRWLQDDAAPAFHTGSPRFDGEWYLIAHAMVVLGLAGVVRRHPGTRPELVPFLHRALDRLRGPRARAHDLQAWGEDPADDAALAGDRGHLGFLGYAAVAFAAGRRAAPRPADEAFGARLVAGLVRRLERSAGAPLETYPGETYPADNAAALAAVALWDPDGPQAPRRRALVRRAAARMMEERDPQSGLLSQRLGGAPSPRASGTAMAAWMLSLADLQLGRPLWEALARNSGAPLGFGAVREHPPGHGKGGDIDSGPVILGFGVSATGFALASARLHRDAARYSSMAATAFLFGLPISGGGQQRFVAGGALGDALLFALLTAEVP
jgi:hypothetical protein